MDFTEFKRRLGAEPDSRDPAFLRAREQAPEFREAAAAADRFEASLRTALDLPAPDDLLPGLQAIACGRRPEGLRRGGWYLAMAAGVVLAVGAALVYRQQHPPWHSVEEYVSVHYRHDGLDMLQRSSEDASVEIGEMLADYGFAATPELAGLVTVVKACPTPDGKGVHMVLDTPEGLVTVILMPRTAVSDGERLAFDDRAAILVTLQSGSAAIVGAAGQDLAPAVSLVQESILPTPNRT